MVGTEEASGVLTAAPPDGVDTVTDTLTGVGLETGDGLTVAVAWTSGVAPPDVTPAETVAPAVEPPTATFAATEGVTGMAGAFATADTVAAVAACSVSPTPASAVFAYPSAASETTPAQATKRVANIFLRD
jgi:hypothetical protein